MPLHHETTLIATIVVGLVLAFGLGSLAHRLRLPPLVGYLLAGVLVGPFTPGFVADAKIAGQLAEIGVILLMFGVGLHFSVRDLISVRWIVIPGAAAQMLVTIGICAVLAVSWGWTSGAGAIIGLALSVASTVVLLRTLEERGVLDSETGRIAVGWLIVQDLAMVVALVLLSALAVHPDGGRPLSLGAGLAVALGLTLAKLAVFVGLMLAVGRRAVPWLLSQAARAGSRELFTLSVLATALGIAFASAELFGVSFALGAFFAGMILSESDLSHHAAADSLPLRDAFAVLFFVSVGMLFDPFVLVEQPWRVAAIVIVIMLIKALPAVLVLLACRQPLGRSLAITAGLAQIGEFSFILAGLGVELGVLPETGRDLILAGALFSIVLNPFVFVAADVATRWLSARPVLATRLERFRNGRPEAPQVNGQPGREDHAIIVGFGRVGRSIGRALDAWDLPYVVIESDLRLVDDLRTRQGLSVVFGDATAAGILSAAGIERARLLIIAAPDGYQARRVLELAREANPGIDTVVRTHSETELARLEAEEVGLAVLAEWELALGMMGYTLRSMGVTAGEAQMFVQSSRRFDDAGRAPGEPHGSAPELKPHQGG